MIWLWVVLGVTVLCIIGAIVGPPIYLYSGVGERRTVRTIGTKGVQIKRDVFITDDYTWSHIEEVFPLEDERNQWYAKNPFYVAWKYDQTVK